MEGQHANTQTKTKARIPKVSASPGVARKKDLIDVLRYGSRHMEAVRVS